LRPVLFPGGVGGPSSKKCFRTSAIKSFAFLFDLSQPSMSDSWSFMRAVWNFCSPLSDESLSLRILADLTASRYNSLKMKVPLRIVF